MPEIIGKVKAVPVDETTDKFRISFSVEWPDIDKSLLEERIYKAISFLLIAASTETPGQDPVELDPKIEAGISTLIAQTRVENKKVSNPEKCLTVVFPEDVTKHIQSMMEGWGVQVPVSQYVLDTFKNAMQVF